jgi:hypothetical protein
MNCANRDTDLLLLAHGELTLWQRLGVYLHLGQCSSCRERLRRFGAVSATLALATRPSLALASDLTPALIARPAILVASLGIMAIALILAICILFGVPRSSGGLNRNIPRCAPDLESDRCR